MVFAVLPSICRPIFFFGSSQIKQNEDNVATVPVLPARPVARHSWMCDGVRSGFSSWRHASDFKVMDPNFWSEASWLSKILPSAVPSQFWKAHMTNLEHSTNSTTNSLEPRGSWLRSSATMWSRGLQSCFNWWRRGDQWPSSWYEINWNHMCPLVSTGHDELWSWNYEIVDDILSQKLVLAEFWNLDSMHYLVLCVQSSSPGIGAAPQRRDPAAFWLSFGH